MRLVGVSSYSYKALLCVLLLHLRPTSALHFYLSVGNSKCFEQISSPIKPMIMSYTLEDNHGMDCNIVIKNSHGSEVNKVEVPKNEKGGKIAFSPIEPDELKVCVSCHGNYWFNSAYVRWSVSFHFGEGDFDSEDTIKKTHVQGVQSTLQKIIRRLDSVHHSGNYERSKEQLFTDVLLNVNSRIVWVSILQILTAFFSSVFIIYHLTSFFKSQKLV